MVFIQAQQLATFLDREIELPGPLNKAKFLTTAVIIEPVAGGGSTRCRNQSDFIVVADGLHRQIGPF